MKAIPYGRQHISSQDIAAVSETLLNDFLTQGPKITEFERAFADTLGAKHCSLVANGTAALHLCALALGIEEGDRVITTPITFVASANGFRYCGAQIEFCDIDPDTFLMDLDKLEQILKKSPKGSYKAVVPVDFAGYPIDSERLRALADEYGFAIVEDACHAPGAWFTDSKGTKKRCGEGHYADMTVFSFHPVKHIAMGEGGAITTNNDSLSDKLSLYRTHGITKDEHLMEQNHGGWYYEMVDLGYNYRATDFQAALGIEQLKRLDWSIEKRGEIAQFYNEALKDIKAVRTPQVAANVHHAYHLYVIQAERRGELYDFLRSNNIFAQVHYVPAHLMPYYRKFGWKKGDMPLAEQYYDRCLSLPMFPTLTHQERQYVADKIKEFYAQ